MQYGSDGIKIRREAETMYQKLMTCLESVREKTDFKPDWFWDLDLATLQRGSRSNRSLNIQISKDFRYRQ